ncbi:hypothetical protein [Oceanobacillus neutriphilus]|uniref:Uncharacterized protein n=1 Tax=Oceanobacillus neutriphilus TaxID=531815 RepID=A0ABQ2P281_9BACI|nr:hypothetical protein [Oceanobacillus neutriphilus]GGP16338.1 hypothetical protein GCM10011346_47830 [Oceanobacillus neutriphilus]
MTFPLDVLPILSLLLLCVSVWAAIHNARKKKSFISTIFLILNGVLFLLILVIFLSYLLPGKITFVSPWIYRSLIAAGVLAGLAAFIKKHIPGQIMSAGLLLFSGYIALFSIGILLWVLFIVQITSSIVNWKKYGLE